MRDLRSKCRVGGQQQIEVSSLEGDYGHVTKTIGREAVPGVGFQPENVARQMKASDLPPPVSENGIGSDYACCDLVEEACGLTFAENTLAFD